MMEQPLSYSLASVNMRRCNATMHTLLETNDSDDILFIQEPWFHMVLVARSDAHPDGVDILGGVAHPAWLSLHPHYHAGARAKVMTYVRKFQCNYPTHPTSLHIATCNDIIAHPCLQLLEVHA